MRKDIQGLRALAVVVVLLYHFWPDRLPGGYVGVDVFFVISGFLITLHLLKKPPVTWGGLASFWARRIKRLIPAATVVLFATVLAALLWLPETMVVRVLYEAAAAAVYGENWMLAAAATDYLAATEASSPVQHYWSLSIEEQFYLVWPVTIGGLFLLGRRLLSAGRLFIIVMTLIFIASLAYSVYITSASPSVAYFVTPARVWELTIGGIIAFISMRFSLPKKYAVPMAWGGLLMIVAAVMLFTKDTPFPGYTALLPTIGTAMVIMAATDTMKWSPRRLLGLKPVQFMGDISYSVYLWHWPILVIAPFAFGITRIPVILAVSLIANIIILAYFTKKYIEDPVRQSKRLAGTNIRSFTYGFASIIAVITLIFVATNHPKVQAIQRTEGLRIALESDPCVGAGVLRDKTCQGRYKDQILGSVAAAKVDRSVLYQHKCWSDPQLFPTERICKYGDRSGDVKIALLGNSHAGMWHAAIESIASTNSWQLDTYLTSSCYTMSKLQALNDMGLLAPGKCKEWNEWAMNKIVREKYNAVIIANRSGTDLIGVEESKMYDEKVAGYKETINYFAQNNVKVFVMRDSPDSKEMVNVPDCLAQSKGVIDQCSGERSKVLTKDPLYEAAIAIHSKYVQTLDLTNRFCSDLKCDPVIGGIVVHFDNNHLTNSYVKTLIPDIAPPLTVFVNSAK